MKPNQHKLISLMTEHNLKAKDVAEMLGTKDGTVRVWRCNISIDIPDTKLQLLELLMKNK